MTLALRVLIKRHLGPMHFAVACFFLVAISYEPLKREHTVRAASIVFHMFMHLFLIVHDIITSIVHSIWPKSYTDYRVLFNPSSHACESLAMQEAFQLPHQYGLGKAGSRFMMNRIDAVVLKASKGEQGSEERLVGKCKSM